MKLLGLRLDSHDANVTYYDGETVRYRSFERDYQNKHCLLYTSDADDD